MSKTDYIVIGGGIIGMMTARELAIQGAKVAIFDCNNMGMATSWAAGGILSSMRPWTEPSASYCLSEQGKKLYPDYVEQLKQETGIDSELIRSGLLIIDKDHATSTKNWAKNKHINLTEDIHKNFNKINIPVESILLPDIAQVRPPRLLNALRQSLNNLAVNIYENTEITNLGFNNGQFQFVEFEGNKLSADALIITAGVWSQSVIKKNVKDKDLEIKPVRGQMLCLKVEELNIENIVLDGPHYFIPRLDGHVLIGSSMEDVGYINETTKEVRNELLEWAHTVYPDLSMGKPVSHWSGLRPATRSSKPIIGPLSNFKNVYINTGHFRKGILQAPSSAKLLVDTLSGKESFMDIEVFNPGLSEKL
jgi:glycine oxidase